jgi:hypothetical protein
LPVAAPPLLNRFVTEPAIPVRRRIEQPSAEKAKRSGCLMWGAVLGVLVGIMVGVYALPPILKHYYGEKVVAPGETYEGSGKVIRFVGVEPNPTEGIPPKPGVVRRDFVATIVVRSDEAWAPEFRDFTLEFTELDDWQHAHGAEGNIPNGFQFEPGRELEVGIHFSIERPEAEGGPLTPKALHLSDPRVKFEIAP